jgi:hypothetical protein
MNPKFIFVVLLLLFLTFSTRAGKITDVIEIDAIINGGNHTITTLIGSDMESIYHFLYRDGRRGLGDEWGLPIYIVSPEVIKCIESYIQSLSFLFPRKKIDDSPFYFVGFQSKDILGIHHHTTSYIGAKPFAATYFWWMLRWIETFPVKENNAELKELLACLQWNFIYGSGQPITVIQEKRMRERLQYEKGFYILNVIQLGIVGYQADCRRAF